jgi:adenylylsulfate kinase-like enzyme
MASFPTVLINGTIGSGKTAVATELGHLLEERRVRCALIDLDWLSWVHLGRDFDRLDELMAQNIATIWPNFVAAGARAFVLTRAIERDATLSTLRRAIPDASLTVIRLTAPQRVIEKRLRQRDAAKELEEHLHDSPGVAEAMEEANIDDAIVSNDGLSLREVAERVLDAWRSVEPDFGNPY